jgi:hypothetical protein
VEEIVNRLLADRDASSIDKRWASNFVERRPELMARFNHKYNYQRAKCNGPEHVVLPLGLQLLGVVKWVNLYFTLYISG